MRTVQYQRWNPPQSPVRIEFPPELPAGLARESRAETRGILYGLLLGGEIRIETAKADAAAPPSRGKNNRNPPHASERVGIFVRRAAGEVFLSESDLERFESQRAAVALVVAGDRAGFFVRQADGSIQSIRSHEEFSLIPGESAGSVATPAPAQATIWDATPEPEPPNPLAAKPVPVLKPARRKGAKSHWSRAAAVFLAVPLAGLAYLKPLSPAPVRLRLTPAGAALAVSWNAAALPHGGVLEILDGPDSVRVEVAPNQSGLSYAPRSGNLEVQMTIDTGSGPQVLDSATLAFQPPSPLPAPASTGAAEVRAQINALEAEASALRESLASGRARMGRLQKVLDKLTHR